MKTSHYSQHLLRKGPFVFSFIEDHSRPIVARDYVLVAKPISKASAKHDKKAARAYRQDGVKPVHLDNRQLSNMSLVHRNFNQ